MNNSTKIWPPHTVLSQPVLLLWLPPYCTSTSFCFRLEEIRKQPKSAPTNLSRSNPGKTHRIPFACFAFGWGKIYRRAPGKLKSNSRRRVRRNNFIVLLQWISIPPPPHTHPVLYYVLVTHCLLIVSRLKPNLTLACHNTYRLWHIVEITLVACSRVTSCSAAKRRSH